MSARFTLRRCLAAAITWLLLPMAASAQPTDPSVRLRISTTAPGEPGMLLREIMARPYVVRRAVDGPVALPRDSTIAGTIVIVGASATVASIVHGDVVVIDGDLFLHPGALIDGRAIAFGGGVYDSRLAHVNGGLLPFRDARYEIDDDAGVIALAFAPPLIEHGPTIFLPGLYGVRLPDYTRVDGLVLPVGPGLTLADGRIAADAVVTYRSHLGTVDPSLELRGDVGRFAVAVAGGRDTRTHDAWSRADWVNAAVTLFDGSDSRNYYRATYAAVRVERPRWLDQGSLTPSIVVETEDARSVGPQAGARRAPWTLLSRHDAEGILRPNPTVSDGRISSVALGLDADFDDGTIVGAGSAVVELPWQAPSNARFAQVTLDGSIALPTVLDHRLLVEGHGVFTVGDVAPAQRFAYLGGGPTIPTLPTLALGGDELLYVAGTYLVPLGWPRLPYVGGLTAGARYLVGSAGVGSLPDFVQNVGGRLALGPLRLDYLIDPASGERAVSVGVSFP